MRVSLAVAVGAVLLGSGCRKAHQTQEGAVAPNIIQCGAAFAVVLPTHYDFEGVITEGTWNGFKRGDKVTWSFDMNDQNPPTGGDPDHTDPSFKTYNAVSNVAVQIGTWTFTGPGPYDWTTTRTRQGTGMDIPIGVDGYIDPVTGTGRGGDFQIVLDGAPDHDPGLDDLKDLDKKTFNLKLWTVSVIDQNYDLNGTITSITKKEDPKDDPIAKACAEAYARL